MSAFSGTVHFVLQKKGGSGKSFVAYILAQHFKSHGETVHCFDTDPANQTFSDFKSLGVEVIDLMQGTRVGEHLIDPMMSRIVEGEGVFLVDTGTSNYLATMAYIVDNDVMNVLAEAGKRVFIHIPICGGGDLEHTTECLSDLTTALGTTPSVRFVIWENDLHGIVHASDLSACKFLEDEGQLSGIVPIRITYDEKGSYRGDTFLKDVKMLTEHCMTVEDMLGATTYPNGEVIDIMKKHRMKRIAASWEVALNAVQWGSHE